MARTAYAHAGDLLAEIVIAGMEAMLAYFGLDRGRRFVRSPELHAGGSGSARVLEIVRQLGGAAYVTGHGARNYLDHAAFADAGIAVEYMNYEKLPYPQLHGAFTPHVSGLDLIANTGRDGAHVIRSGTIDWRQFTSTRSPSASRPKLPPTSAVWPRTATSRRCRGSGCARSRATATRTSSPGWAVRSSRLPRTWSRRRRSSGARRPDVIVETGIAHGGSLIYYAALFKAIGKGRVIGIDIEIRPHNRQPSKPTRSRPSSR